MRQKLEDEIKTREAMQDAIAASVQHTRHIYPSPSAMHKILKADGIVISRQTLYTAYEQLGINHINGLWVKEGER